MTNTETTIVLAYELDLEHVLADSGVMIESIEWNGDDQLFIINSRTDRSFAFGPDDELAVTVGSNERVLAYYAEMHGERNENGWTA